MQLDEGPVGYLDGDVFYVLSSFLYLFALGLIYCGAPRWQNDGGARAAHVSLVHARGWPQLTHVSFAMLSTSSLLE